ncbi:hypothetical protein [Butyrivibrio sp. NC3005]|uniref:hypothetical protein n=1 Tax=Butyrivibrio sp. NC3005 TaxID=1280685 RepID=UPI000429A6DC|nr:hypothetical protein [Butyrivibrio sp. NC3005]
MLNRLERKYGKYAISNLTIKLLIVYAVGYLLMNVGFNVGYLTFDPYEIFHGQIWRIVSWILIPTSGGNSTSDIMLFAISILLFYLPVGRLLERVWGDFRYNLYILSGFVFTMLGSLIMYFVLTLSFGSGSAVLIGPLIGACTTTYFVTMSIVLAYAFTFPDATMLFMFILPVQMKWFGMLYGAYFTYVFGSNIFNFIKTGQFAYLVIAVIIVCSFINFAIFYFLTRKGNRRGGVAFKNNIQKNFHKSLMKEKKSREEKNSVNVKMTPKGHPIHKCAVCGKTEADDPNAEFRFCSKCNGNYEYCQDHLFTHVHVK